MNEEIILVSNENNEFFEPYTTIIVKTEEDMKFIEEAVEKQKEKKVIVKDYIIGYPDYYCPICRKQQKDTNKNKTKGCYCERCGQKLTWKGEADEDIKQ